MSAVLTNPYYCVGLRRSSTSAALLDKVIDILDRSNDIAYFDSMEKVPSLLPALLLYRTESLSRFLTGLPIVELRGSASPAIAVSHPAEVYTNPNGITDCRRRSGCGLCA